MMGFDLFGWLRRKAAEAVVQGVADGVQAIAPEGEPAPVDLDQLRTALAARVQPKSLAAAKDDGAEGDEDEKPKRGKK